MTIQWGNLPTYNTVMSVAAGAGLLLVVLLGRDIRRRPQSVSVLGYSMAFIIIGTILTLTGLHMTLTWPLAPAFPFDNIIFGEPALAFGVILLVVGVFGSFHGKHLLLEPDVTDRLAEIARPLSIFVFGIGLGCIGIAAAGMRWQLFVAPPAEPVTGWWFSDYPWVEATFISALYFLVGLGAALFPLGLVRRGIWTKVIGWAWTIAGAAFLLFGAFNFFSHIGLIVETMPSGG